MRKYIFVSMFLIFFLILPLPVHSARLTDIQCEYNTIPDGAYKDAQRLVDGDIGSGLRWMAGNGKPLSVAIKFKLAEAEKIDHIKLVSTSPNWWQSVPRIKLFGEKPGDSGWCLLADRDWYIRVQDPDKEIDGERKYELTITLEPERYKRFKLDLIRPHSNFNMPLSEVQFHITNVLDMSVGSNWLAYSLGQVLKGTVRFDNTTADALKNVKAEVNLVRLADEKVAAKCWEGKLDLVVGQKEIDFEFAIKETGTFRLAGNVFADSGKVKVNYLNSPSIEIVPPRSKYWFPIGTCHEDKSTPHYGFNAFHYWYHIEKTKSLEGTYDRYAISVKQGLADSVVSVPEWTDIEDLGIEADDCYMQTHQGAKLGEAVMGGNISHHLPRRDVTGNQKDRMAFWDGHPGLYQAVFNNELCYATWSNLGALVDYSKYSIADYHKYLAEQHKSIDILNNLYGTGYSSFDEVEPPREFTGPGPDWYDWLQHRKVGLAKFIKHCYDVKKKYLPNTIVTPKPIQLGDYYAGSTAIDPWLWREAGDIYGYDLYPGARGYYFESAFGMDFHRTQVGGKQIQFLESGLAYFRPSSLDRKALDFNRVYWPAFLRGLDGCYWYSWHIPWDKAQRRYRLNDAQGTLFETGEEAARMAKQIQTLAPVLNFGKPLGAEIALYYSWEELEQTPNIAPMNALRGAYRILTQLHYPVDIISYHNVRAGELSKYKVFVLAGARHLSPDVAIEVKEFVSNGGLLIADMQAGFYDHYHRRTKTLESVLGAQHIEVNDGLNQMALTESLRFDIPEILTEPTAFENQNWPATVAPLPRAEVIKANTQARVVATFPEDIVMLNVLDRVHAQTPTFEMPATSEGKEQGPPKGLAGAIVHKYGKGKTLYVASAIFSAYRNYLYTLSIAPNPASRGNELLNNGNANMRKLFGDFLKGNNILPVADVDLRDEDPQVDDMRYQILSYFGNEECVLLGVTNWGPERRYGVPASMHLPFGKAEKVYYMDTPEETLTILPFKQNAGILETTIPHLDGTGIIIVVGESGPLLATAQQSADSGPIKVTLFNHLSEDVTGTIQLRVDGIEEAISEKIPFTLKQGKTDNYSIAVTMINEKLLTNNLGKKRPWYAWVTFDGNARAFARIHTAGRMLAP